MINAKQRCFSSRCWNSPNEIRQMIQRTSEKEEKDAWRIDRATLLTNFSPAPSSLFFSSVASLLRFAAFYYSYNRIWDGDSAGDFGFVYGNTVVGPTMPPLNASLSARTDAHSKLPLAPSPPVIFRNQTIRPLSHLPLYCLRNHLYIIANRRN